MDISWIIAGLASALLAALLAGAAGIRMLRRDNRLLREQATTLVEHIESLDDRVWDLAASEALHRSLVESLGDLVVRRSGIGRILYANAAYAELFGTTPEALRGQDTLPLVVATTPAQARSDGLRHFDELLRLPDGRERWIAWSETPVSLEGDATVLQRVGRDITGRVAAERMLAEARAKAESASEAKSRFLATVSHEFRTPLNGILGMCDLIDDTGPNPEQAAYVRALRTSGEALLTLVDEILDFAKVEAGRIELQSEPLDPGRLVEDVVELMAPRAQAKGLDIAADIAADAPGEILGDSERLRQILVNLVGNAVKFTATGGVRVALRKTAGGIAFAVEDTGAGIAAERLEAIFLEFEQADAETGRIHGGTGLGLAIVRRLAEAMGGTVAAESTPGAGSRFVVSLPAPAEAGPAAAAPGWSGRNVLILSPSVYSGPAMAAMAEAGSARVRLERTLEEALAALGNTRADAVVIDHAFGAAACETLRAAAAAARQSRVLVALSPLERRSLGRPADLGYAGYLVRPVRARSFFDRLFQTGTPSERPPRLEPRASTASLRVLIAEDNEINALILMRTLERQGSQPVWARDGQEGLALAESALRGEIEPFDLLLLDVRMPHLDGLEVARRIRAAEAADGAIRRLPIVGVSANVAEADVAAACAAGMDDCLAKPLDRARLLAWLTRIGEGRGRNAA